ncbi:unnamed protein product [Larinioides sclopetarius]|uniref:Uncharacterized protein n=1 Tax=Larinioides sclopetarius TaxID=280406 RepID=A0AAV1ZR91_9ARAC
MIAELVYSDSRRKTTVKGTSTSVLENIRLYKIIQSNRFNMKSVELPKFFVITGFRVNSEYGDSSGLQLPSY